MKFLKKILISLLIGFSVSYAGAITSAQCKVATKGFSSAVEIATKSITTIYNVFPIRIGNVPLFKFPNLEDHSELSSMPVCFCIKPPSPIPIPGVKISLWEPIALVETTALPLCTPTFGMSIPLNIGIGTSSIGSVDTESIHTLNTYQAHYIKYPVFKLLNMFMDFVCLQIDGSIDIGYLTEIDPVWQNDSWSAILNPEVFLVSNVIAQFACIADAIASSMGFPLDPLWWCFGSWGSAFPLTQNVEGTTNVEAAANITAKLLMKLHRQLMLWGSVGEAGLCYKYPMPVMRKSQYGIFPIYPIGFPYRIPVGRTGFLWDEGQDMPVINLHTWVWSVYRKRDCCAF